MLFYIINLIVILVFVGLMLISRHNTRRWIKTNNYLDAVTNTANSIRYGNLTTKIGDVKHPTYKNVTESINRMVETLNDREKMINEYQTELDNQNKLLESVINSLSDGILIINDKAVILRVTPLICHWFGTDKEELINKNIFEYIQINDNEDIYNANNLEIFIKHTPTNNYVMQTIKLPTDDEKRYVILIKDVTKSREIETLKEDFVATLTHDLKVPIVAEANIINFLLDGKFGDVSDKQRVALLNMKTSNQELVELVQIILETYKVKDTGMNIVKEDINLNEFLKKITSEMQSIANDFGIIIVYNSDKDLSVSADSIQLERVIKNLINNAIYHSGTQEKIDIVTGINDGCVTISVIDYGQGIAQDELKLIFNKYYSAVKKFRKIGTGLGLYLSQQIVQAHGGEITVTSEENIKTEFCVKLPANI